MEVRKMLNSSTTTEADLIEPIHPGEILMEDFIEGFGITQNKLAVSIGVPPRRINEIVHGKRGITADTAIRLARYFGTSEEFWMNLQSNYELRMERRALQDKVAEITPLKVA
ncbi:HigA family addiction module antitoxin [Humibacter antri]